MILVTEYQGTLVEICIIKKADFGVYFPNVVLWVTAKILAISRSNEFFLCKLWDQLAPSANIVIKVPVFRFLD